MKKFTAKEQQALILRGLCKDPIFTEEEARERSEVLRKNPRIEELCIEVFGGLMMAAADAKRSMDRADDILTLIENVGMSDVRKLPPIDGRTLLSIIVKVTDETKKAARSIQAKENAEKGHAITNEARAFVWGKWVAEKNDYDGNKTAFARHYVKIIANTFNTASGDPLIVTERTISETWLKSPAC